MLLKSFLVFPVFLLVFTASGITYTVPSVKTPTIQSAIDIAIDGDEILVMPGTYTSTKSTNVIEVLGKNITIRSFGGADDTYIDGEGLNRAINCDNASTIRVEGFTIINGLASGSGAGGGAAYIHPGSSATFILCAFKDCSAHSGGALFSGGSAIVEVIECTFEGNISTYSSAGNAWEHYSSGGTCTIDSSVMTANQTVWQNPTQIVISNSLLCGVVTGTDGGGNTFQPNVCEVALPMDCNNNGVLDQIEIFHDSTLDSNGNGIRDECECNSDLNSDGVVNTADLLSLIAYWGSAGSIGDLNGDAEVGIADLLILIGAWGTCP